MSDVPSLLRDYSTWLVRQEYNPRTVKAYLYEIAELSDWVKEEYVGAKDLVTVSSPEIAEFVAFLDRKGLKSSTVNRRICSFHRFFKWLREEAGRITSDPMEGVVYYRPPPKASEPLPDATVRAVFQAMEARVIWASSMEAHGKRQPTTYIEMIRDRAIFSLVIFCGLKREAFDSLCVGGLWVSQGGRVKGGTITIRLGEWSIRKVSVPPITCSYIQQWLEYHPNPQPSSPLFVALRGHGKRSNGGRLMWRGIQRAFRNTVDSSSVPGKVLLKDLREWYIRKACRSDS